MSATTLRFATLNVWALPFGVARHVPERMMAIAREIERLELDVVGLQEVWTNEARAQLIAETRGAGYVHTWHRPGDARGGSGLMFLSREPLGDVRFEPFWLAGLPQRIHHGDYWGGKGFATARLTTPGGPVLVINTHLQAQYTPDPVDEYRGIRTAQGIQIAGSVARRPEPVVALGDFNMREGNPDHAVLLGLSQFTDPAVALDNPQDTILAPHPYRGAGHSGGERIDYAFCRPGTQTGARPLKIERVFDGTFEVAGEAATFSDHAGLCLTAEIAPQPARMLPAVDAEAIDRARGLLRRGRAEAARRRGIERSLALGSGALAAAAFPGAAQLRASRRRFLAALATGVGFAALPGALVAGLLSERAVPAELDAYERIEELLEDFVVAA